MVTVGAVLSRVTVIVSVLLFPAASVAVTVMVFAPTTRLMGGTSWLMDGTDQVVVPVAAPPVALAALVQVTNATPTLSEAVPANAMADAFVT